MKTYSRKKSPVELKEDVQSLCRLCLSKTDVMTPVYNGDMDVFLGIPMRIVTCLGLEVSQDDNLPQFICQQCKTELDRFYNFKKNCTTNYWRLKSKLNIRRNTVKGDSVSEEKNMSNSLPLSNDGAPIVISNYILEKDKEQAYMFVPSNLSVSGAVTVTDANAQPQNNKKVDSFIVNLEDEQSVSHLPTGSTVPHQQTKNSQVELVIEQAHGLVETVDDQIMDVEEFHGESEEELQENNANVISTKLLSEYLVSALVENGMLSRWSNGLEVLNPNLKTLYLETGLGSEIIMELVEEGLEEAGTPCSETFSRHARSCVTCGARLSSAGALRRHARVHTGERPYACDVCPRRFAQREVLRRHRLLHGEKLPFQCAWCPKAYTQRGALGAHERAHVLPGAPPPPRRCPLCPKVFQHASGLSRHMSVHQGRDYTCESCSRTFKDKSSLRRHERGHQRARAS